MWHKRYFLLLIIIHDFICFVLRMGGLPMQKFSLHYHSFVLIIAVYHWELWTFCFVSRLLPYSFLRRSNNSTFSYLGMSKFIGQLIGDWLSDVNTNNKSIGISKEPLGSKHFYQLFSQWNMANCLVIYLSWVWGSIYHTYKDLPDRDRTG